MTRPIAEMLLRAGGFGRFHMPGHKGRLERISPEMDMTELWNTDDLYDPVSGIREAEALLKRSAGTGASMLLAGGSTSGIHAMLLAALHPGEKLLVTRDAHHSVFSGCALGGIEPVALEPGSDLAAAIPGAGCQAALVTYPDYYGHCPDLAAIVQAAARHGVKVLSDSAHGAHFHWWQSPRSAAKLGADFSAESAHKTLGCLTGGAWLHLKNAQDAPLAREMLRMTFTSSPSFLILRSADDARAWMDENGRDALAGLLQASRELRREIDKIPGLRAPAGEDETRLVVDVSGLGLTGWEAYDQLRENGLALEMADFCRVVAILTVFDGEEDFGRLLSGFRALRAGARALPEFPRPVSGKRAMELRKAAFSPTKRIPLNSAAGEIAARAVGAYPPGWPTILPGERITREIVEYFAEMERLGAKLFGAEGGWISIVDKGESTDAVRYHSL